MGPKLNLLREAFQAERVELSATPTASDPELVIVFDLAGPVDSFYKAAALIPGLSFLFALEDDPVPPDEDFYYEDSDGEPTDDDVPQSLYMVMSNAGAVAQLIDLFDRWKVDRKVQFAHGLNSLKQVFDLLHDVRRWGPSDRVRETGVLEYWHESVAVASQQPVRVEIELWYRRTAELRATSQERVRQLLASSGGTLITSSVIPEIEHHSLLVELPRRLVEQVLAEGAGSIELLTVEDVMLVAPSGQHSVRSTDWRGAIEPETLDAATPTGEPIVALLDGLPMSGHIALSGRLNIDDPDDLSAHYEPSQQRHGTAMASLIAHGPLDAPGVGLGRPIYVRPVLRPDPNTPELEVFPTDSLLIDVLHRSLHRIFVGDAGAPAAAPSVRIVNLSVGDPARVFVRRMSPHARLIDWFAHRYNVLIVVSAGNHAGVETWPEVATENLEDPEKLRSDATRSLHRSERLRRLLAPAESINAVTVGALHSDTGPARQVRDTLVDALLEGTPANYSAIGFGFHRAVKPDVLLPGGRQLFERPVADAQEQTIRLAATTAADVSGITVAAPGLAGEVMGTSLAIGTSNAAALATRSLARILDTLADPDLTEDDFPFPDDELHPALAKALLVHAASWRGLKATLTGTLGLQGHGQRNTLTQMLGYGPVWPDDLASAATNRVVLLGGATIKGDSRHTYRFPLPLAIRASADWRRLAITLAWISAVEPRTQRYRAARLSFSPPSSEVGVDQSEADGHAVRRGTVQHQVLEGRHAVVFDDGAALAIAVDCRVDVGSPTVMTRYGLVASLEVGATILTDIHAQVRNSLRVRAQAQVRERVRPR